MASHKITEDGSDPTASAVAEAALPGWRALGETSMHSPGGQESAALRDAPPSPAVDAVMPTIEQLRAKYLGALDAAPRPEAGAGRDAGDTRLVEMQAGPLRRTVAVSLAEKKVIWSQG